MGRPISRAKAARLKKILEAASAPSSPWIEGKVKMDVRLVDGRQRSISVDGYTMGTLAVHQGINDHAGIWSLTHVPTGLRFAWVATAESARRIGEVFNDRCTRALLKGSKEEILNAVSEEVKGWLSRCIEARKFLEPPPVEEAADA